MSNDPHPPSTTPVHSTHTAANLETLTRSSTTSDMLGQITVTVAEGVDLPTRYTAVIVDTTTDPNSGTNLTWKVRNRCNGVSLSHPPGIGICSDL